MNGVSDQSSRELAEAIRACVRDEAPSSREQLAAYGLTYCRGFLLARRALRRFGFDGSFTEVVDIVAAQEVAELLRPSEPRDSGSSTLVRRLAAAVSCARLQPGGRAGADESSRPTSCSSEQIVLEAADQELVLAYRRILRLRADQGLSRHWAAEHPDEERLLRALKRACRDSEHTRLQRDLRGTLVITRSSDLSKRALTAAEIRDHLGDCHARFSAILTALWPRLIAGPDHGGYCYLMDLVREIHADHLRRFVVWQSGGSAASPNPRIASNGVPLDLTSEKIRGSLYRMAEEILNRDSPEVPLQTRRAWSEVAVKMILRGYGLDLDVSGAPNQSQRDLLRSTLGSSLLPDRLRYHDGQTTYLIRRLRARWQR